MRQKNSTKEYACDTAWRTCRCNGRSHPQDYCLSKTNTPSPSSYFHTLVRTFPSADTVEVISTMILSPSFSTIFRVEPGPSRHITVETLDESTCGTACSLPSQVRTPSSCRLWPALVT